MTTGRLEPVGYYATVENLDGFLNGVQQIEHSSSRLTAFSVAAGNMISSALSSAFSSLLNFGKDSINVAVDFEAQMALMEVAASNSAVSMQELSDFAIEMGAKTFESAQGAAVGMTNLLKAGIDAEDVMAIFPAISNLAAASSLDLAAASDAVVITMKTFNVGVEDVDAIVNNFVQSADASVTEVNELVQAMSSAGPVAESFGLEFEDLNTALAIMSERGIRGANAGTMLKSMLLNLQRPTDAVQEGLAKLGVELYDQEGNARAFSDVVGELTLGMEVLRASGGEELANEVAQAVAGTYGIGAFQALTSGGLTETFAWVDDSLYMGLDKIAEAAGTTVEELERLGETGELASIGVELYGPLNAAWEDMSGAIYDAADAMEVADVVFETVSGKSEELSGGIETIAIIIGDVLLPILHDGLDFLNDQLVPAIIGLLTGEINLFGALEQIFKVDLDWAEELVSPVLALISEAGNLITDAMDAIGGTKYEYTGPEQFRALFEELGPEKFEAAMADAEVNAANILDRVTTLFTPAEGEGIIDTQPIEDMKVDVDSAVILVDGAQDKVDYISNQLSEMRIAFSEETEHRADVALLPGMSDEELEALGSDIDALELELVDAQTNLLEKTSALETVRADFTVTSAQVVSDFSTIREESEAAELELEIAQQNLISAQAGSSALLIEAAESILSDAEQNLNIANDKYALAIGEVQTLTRDLSDSKEDVDSSIIELQESIPDTPDELLGIDPSSWYKQETLGDVIGDMLGIEDLDQDLANAWQPIKDFFDGIGTDIKTFISGINTSGIEAAWNTFVTLIESIVAWVDSNVLGGESTTGTFLERFIANFQIEKTITSGIEAAWNIINTVWKQYIKPFAMWVIANVQAFVDVLTGSAPFMDSFLANFNLGTTLANGIKSAWDIILQVYNDVLKPLVEFVVSEVDSFIQKLTGGKTIAEAIAAFNIGETVANAIDTAWSILKTVYETAIKPIIDFVVVNIESFISILTGESKVSDAVEGFNIGKSIVSAIEDAWFILIAVFESAIRPVVLFIEEHILTLFSGGAQRVGDDVTELVDLDYDEMTLIEKAWQVVVTIIETIANVLSVIRTQIEEEGEFSLSAVFEGLGLSGLNLGILSKVMGVFAVIASNIKDFFDSFEGRNFSDMAAGAAVVATVLAALFAPGLILAAVSPLILAGITNALSSILDFVEHLGEAIRSFGKGDIGGGFENILKMLLDVLNAALRFSFGVARGILELLGIDPSAINTAEKSLEQLFSIISLMFTWVFNMQKVLALEIENIIAQISLALAKTGIFGIDKEYWEKRTALTETRATEEFQSGQSRAAIEVTAWETAPEDQEISTDEFVQNTLGNMETIWEEEGNKGLFGYFNSMVNSDLPDDQKDLLADKFADILGGAWQDTDLSEMNTLALVFEEFYEDNEYYDEAREGLSDHFWSLFQESLDDMGELDPASVQSAYETFVDSFDAPIPEAVKADLQDRVVGLYSDLLEDFDVNQIVKAGISVAGMLDVTTETSDEQQEVVAAAFGDILTGAINIMTRDEKVNLFEILDISPEAALEALDYVNAVNMVIGGFSDELDEASASGDFDSVRDKIARYMLELEGVEVGADTDLSTLTDPFAKNIVDGVTFAVGQYVAGTATMDEANDVRDWVIREFNTAFDAHSPAMAMEPIGIAIVDGILAPLLNAGAAITYAANKFATDFVAQLEEAFNIRSPSKLTEQTGKYLGQGLIQGFTNTVNDFSPNFLGQPNAAMARNQYNSYDNSIRNVNFNGPINGGQSAIDKMNLVGV